MNIVAAECAVKKHHPEWSNVSGRIVFASCAGTDELSKVYNTTFIRWTTHSPPGLSEKDVLMARFCDEKAAECGEVVQEGESSGGVGKELADRVASEGKDCCVPKKDAAV
jgi:4a-hydroxytetrahydrobiopterin dehydratase